MSIRNQQLKDPLVSVVIVNWNYGRFVGEAIASIKNQSYKNLECIVVDNGSTDDSLSTIAQALAGDPRFRLKALPTNLGHLGGALSAVPETLGEFLVFLDADDFFFDNFLACHVQAHLTSRQPTSFTSSNIAVVNSDGAMVSGAVNCVDKKNGLFERTLAASPLHLVEGLRAEEYDALERATYFGPPEIARWFWTPGSSNMIRKALLLLFAPSSSTPVPFGGFDAFFMMPLFALTGTTFIDLPLSAYRIHAHNDHSRMPRMHGLRDGNQGAYERNTNVKKMLLKSLIERCEFVVPSVSPERRYFQILELVARNSIDSILISRESIFASGEFKHLLAKKYTTLVKIFSERVVLDGLRKFVHFKDLAHIIWLAYHGRIPFATVYRAASIEMRNRWKRSKQ